MKTISKYIYTYITEVGCCQSDISGKIFKEKDVEK